MSITSVAFVRECHGKCISCSRNILLHILHQIHGHKTSATSTLHPSQPRYTSTAPHLRLTCVSFVSSSVSCLLRLVSPAPAVTVSVRLTGSRCARSADRHNLRARRLPAHCRRRPPHSCSQPGDRRAAPGRPADQSAPEKPAHSPLIGRRCQPAAARTLTGGKATVIFMVYTAYVGIRIPVDISTASIYVG